MKKIIIPIIIIYSSIIFLIHFQYHSNQENEICGNNDPYIVQTKTLNLEEFDQKKYLPRQLCDLNNLISEGEIQNIQSDTISIYKYLILKPEIKTLDKALASNIFSEKADYQKFYLIEKNEVFSSLIYRFDKDGYSSVHLTTIDNGTCELIDNILLEERDTFQGEIVGTTSIQINPSTYMTTFFEEGIDYNNNFWKDNPYTMEFIIDDTGEIFEYSNGIEEL